MAITLIAGAARHAAWKSLRSGEMNVTYHNSVNYNELCLRDLPHARARARRVVPISELLFGTLTQNQSSLEPALGFAAITGTPRIVDRARYIHVLPRAR